MTQGYPFDPREFSNPHLPMMGAFDAQYRWGPWHPAQVEALWMLDLAWFHAND
jgi:hypothetical protein